MILYMILEQYSKLDKALFILRIGMGLMFFLHGYPKLMGGMEKWQGLGAYGMGAIGIHFLPVFWGFMAAFSECIGGLMIVLGIQTRNFSLLLLITMIVAVASHLKEGDGVIEASHAIEAAFIFLFLFLSGSGKIAIKND